MKEIWKTVIVDGVENPRYKVSSLGRVMNMDFRGTGKPRICRLTDSKGYLTVRIDRVMKKVHRLVAEAFIPNPKHKPFIDHIDTNRKNNIVEVDKNGVAVENSKITNLRWCTCEENNNNPLSRKHISENNPHNKPMLGKLGAEHNRSKSIVQLSKDGKFIKKWSAVMEVERELGINHGHITLCCQGKRKSAGGFKWMYYSDWVKKSKKPTDIKPLF